MSNEQDFSKIGNVIVKSLRVGSDNLCHLLINQDSRSVCLFDPGESDTVERYIEAEGLKLDTIMLTHRHLDHTAGAKRLKRRFGCRVAGPGETEVFGVDLTVEYNDLVDAAGLSLRVIATPGHTRGHVVYLYESTEEGALFSGDTLFLMGCGRILDGSAGQMWQSLKRLRSLPGATQIFCGHDYLAENSRFALLIEPWNKTLAEYAAGVAGSLSDTIETQCRNNPFLRADDPALRHSLGVSEDLSDSDLFARIRGLKDNF